MMTGRALPRDAEGRLRRASCRGRRRCRAGRAARKVFAPAKFLQHQKKFAAALRIRSLSRTSSRSPLLEDLYAGGPLLEYLEYLEYLYWSTSTQVAALFFLQFVPSFNFSMRRVPARHCRVNAARTQGPTTKV